MGIHSGEPVSLSLRLFRREALRLFHHCQWCNRPLTGKTATVDHIRPLNMQGSDSWSNLCLACDPCNKRKDCHWEGELPKFGPTDWTRHLQEPLPPVMPRRADLMFALWANGRKTYRGTLAQCNWEKTRLIDALGEGDAEVRPE